MCLFFGFNGQINFNLEVLALVEFSIIKTVKKYKLVLKGENRLLALCLHLYNVMLAFQTDWLTQEVLLLEDWVSNITRRSRKINHPLPMLRELGISILSWKKRFRCRNRVQSCTHRIASEATMKWVLHLLLRTKTNAYNQILCTGGKKYILFGWLIRTCHRTIINSLYLK